MARALYGGAVTLAAGLVIFMVAYAVLQVAFDRYFKRDPIAGLRSPALRASFLPAGAIALFAVGAIYGLSRDRHFEALEALCAFSGDAALDPSIPDAMRTILRRQRTLCDEALAESEAEPQ